MLESNRRYDLAFSNVLAHTTDAELEAFWKPFAEEDSTGANFSRDIFFEHSRAAQAAAAAKTAAEEYDVVTKTENPMVANPPTGGAVLHAGNTAGHDAAGGDGGNKKKSFLHAPRVSETIDLGAGTRLSEDAHSLFGASTTSATSATRKASKFEGTNPMNMDRTIEREVGIRKKKSFNQQGVDVLGEGKANATREMVPVARERKEAAGQSQRL